MATCWKSMLILLAFSAATAVTPRAPHFNVVLDFLGGDGANPEDVRFVQGVDGSLYGTTAGGGASRDGTIFKIDRTGKLTNLYNFCAPPCEGGYDPVHGLVLGTDGNFYGTTPLGGPGNSGAFFRITASGKLTTLHTFPNGESPGALIQAADGNFYGNTYVGGTYNKGTAFKITRSGVLTTLHSFNGSDGQFLSSALLQASNGNFYGEAPFGGESNDGTIFEMTPQGEVTVLYNFSGNDGSQPNGGLIEALDGNLYGTANGGGTEGAGTVFKITPSGQFTLLHVFEPFNGTDGGEPEAALAQATDGNFYGTTVAGGPSNVGTLFQMTPAGTVTILHSFTSNDGAYPAGPLLQATDGHFYGSCTDGGVHFNYGTVFQLNMGLGRFVGLVHNPAKVGQNFAVLGQALNGTSSVSLNGTPAQFSVKSDTFILATVSPGATSGYVTVTTPTGVLTSNVPFRVIQ